MVLIFVKKKKPFSLFTNKNFKTRSTTPTVTVGPSSTRPSPKCDHESWGSHARVPSVNYYLRHPQRDPGTLPSSVTFTHVRLRVRHRTYQLILLPSTSGLPVPPTRSGFPLSSPPPHSPSFFRASFAEPTTSLP